MNTVVDVGLPALAQPFSWAVRVPAGRDLLFTTHGPVKPDGSIETGSIEDQARLTFANLQRAMAAAGGSLTHVAQVLIYLVDVADMAAVDAVYREFFKPPYPGRSSAAVAALVALGMGIEIVVTAAL